MLISINVLHMILKIVDNADAFANDDDDKSNDDDNARGYAHDHDIIWMERMVTTMAILNTATDMMRMEMVSPNMICLINKAQDVSVLEQLSPVTSSPKSWFESTPYKLKTSAFLPHKGRGSCLPLPAKSTWPYLEVTL